MKIPRNLFINRPYYQDERGSLKLISCPTAPIETTYPELGTEPTQIVITNTNPHTGRGLHFQKSSPLLQVVSVIHGEIIECMIKREVADNNYTYTPYSQKIKSTDEDSTFIVPPGWGHGFFTKNSSAVLLYLVWGARNLSDEFGLNLKSSAFKFLDETLKDKIFLNERDSKYEYI